MRALWRKLLLTVEVRKRISNVPERYQLLVKSGRNPIRVVKDQDRAVVACAKTISKASPQKSVASRANIWIRGAGSLKPRFIKPLFLSSF